MNKVFKVIWNHATQSWVAVSELTSAKGKTKSKTNKVAAVSLAVSSALWATSSDAAVLVSGTGTSVVLVADNVQSAVNTRSNKSITIGSKSSDDTVNVGGTGTGNFGISIGAGAQGTGERSISIGEKAEATGSRTISIGSGAAAVGNNSIAQGDGARAGHRAIAIGNGAKAFTSSSNGSRGATDGTPSPRAIGQIAIGDNATATSRSGVTWTSAQDAIAIGRNSYVEQTADIAIGAGALVKQGNYTGLNKNNNKWGVLSSLAVGSNAESASTSGDTMLGPYATNNLGQKFQFGQSTAVGSRAFVWGDQASALSADSTAMGNSSVSLGGDDIDKAKAKLTQYIPEIRKNGINLAKLPNLLDQAYKQAGITDAEVTEYNAWVSGGRKGARNDVINKTHNVTALILSNDGVSANNIRTAAIGDVSMALGTSSQAGGTGSQALGVNALARGESSIAQGVISRANGTNSIAMGTVAAAEADNSNAIGYYSLATERSATALGTRAHAKSRNSITIGSESCVTGRASMVLGAHSNVTGITSMALGSNITTVRTNNSVVLGYNSSDVVGGVTTNVDGSTQATDSLAFSGASDPVQKVNNASVRAANGFFSYEGFAGQPVNSGQYVSIGTKGQERQIKNLAAGAINQNSTDAINGSQLYAVMHRVETGFRVKNNDQDVPGNIVVDKDGNIQPANNISIVPSDVVNFNNGNFTTAVVTANASGKGTGANVTFNVNNQTIDTTTVNTTSPGALNVTSTTDGVATTKNVAEAINAAYWKVGDNAKAVKHNVSAGHQVNFVNGTGVNATVTAEANGQNDVSFSINTDNATIQVNATTNKVEAKTAGLTTQVNNNGTISVPTGEAGTSLVNASTVAKAINDASFNVSTKAEDKFATQTTTTAKVKAGGNVTYIAGKNIAIEQDNQNFTFSTTENVVFNNAQVNSTLTIGNGTTTSPKVNITSTTAGLNLTNGTAPVAINNVESFLPGTANYKGNAVTATEVAAPTFTAADKARAATIDDVVNTGWNLRGQKTAGGEVDAVDFVKPYDTVVFKSGNNATTDVVTTTDANNKVSTITITAKAEPVKTSNLTTTVNNNGTVSVATGDAGTNLVNASTVAKAINDASFNVSTKAEDRFATQTTKTAKVKAGGNVTYIAGKNIAIEQDNQNFTFSTTENVTFTNANVTNTLALGNGTTGSSSPVVNLKTENATEANVNNEAPTSALNITSADGKPTQIKGVGSSLNTTTVNVTPITDTTRTTETLLDLGNTTKPLSENVLNSVATVRDLTNLGWVVSANGNSYKDTVTNAKEVKFNGVNGVSVTGNTTDGVRNINISLNTTTLTSNANGTTAVTNGNNYVNGTTVANAINNAGWNTTLSDGTTLNVNPGDQVNYVNGNGTKANVTTVKDANGKDVVSVSYDVNSTTGSVNPNGTVSVTDGKSFLNASSVANLVNNASFSVSTKAEDKFATQTTKTAKVKAGGNVTYIAGKNIAIEQDNQNFTFSTTENVTFTNANVTNKLTIGNGTANSPKVDITSTAAGLDFGGNKLTNVSRASENYTVPADNDITTIGGNVNAAKGNIANLSTAKDGDVLTVADAKNLGWVVSATNNSYAADVKNANEVRFNGNNGIVVDGKTTQDGVRLINISIKAGEVTANTTTGKAENGTANFVTGSQVESAINKAGWLTNVTNAATGASETKVVTPGTQVDYVNGNGTTANVTLKDGKVAVSYNVNQTKGSVNPNGTVSVTDGKAFLNASSVANLVNNASFSVSTKAVDKFATQTAKTAQVKAGGNVTYIAGKNIAIEQDNQNFTFSTTENVTFTNANVNSTLTVGNGTNATTITSDDKGLNIANAKGEPTNINGVANGTLANGSTQAANSGQVFNAGNSTANIIGGGATFNTTTGKVENFNVSVDKKPTTLKPTENYQAPSAATNVADAIKNLNSYVNAGWKIGNTTSVVERIAPDEQVNFVNSSTVNAFVVANNKGGANVSFQVNTTSVTNTVLTNAKGNVGASNITYKAQYGAINEKGELEIGKDGNRFATVSEVAGAINNSGWTTKLSNGTVAPVKPGQAVNYVNGTGTVANVTKDANGAINVTYDAKVDGTTIKVDSQGNIAANTTELSRHPNNNGTITFNSANGNNLVNASTVANAINSASFNATIANSGAWIDNQAGKANATVKAGSTVTYTAGKNIAIKQDGANFTFATTKDVTFENAQVNQTLSIGNDTAGHPRVNITTSGTDANPQLDMGKAQLTNVSKATDGNFNSDPNKYNVDVNGDPLVKAADGKYYRPGDVTARVNPQTGAIEINPISTATAVTPATSTQANAPLATNVTKAAGNIADLSSSNPSNAITVEDAKNLGWVVSASDNDYADSVKNANRVDFKAEAGTGVTVKGATDAAGVRTITIGNDYLKANATTGSTAANAAGSNSVAVGPNSVANTEGSVAIGNNAKVETNAAKGSVAIGAGSTAGKVNTGAYRIDGSTDVAGNPEDANTRVVSVGNATSKAQIQNVAAGVVSATSTDAVNGSQLNATNVRVNQNAQNIAHLDHKVNRMGKDLRAGIAGANAAAGLPQVYIPGKSMVAAAAGTFKGQSAVAVGYSRASDNGKVILKLQGNANTRGEVGGSVGVGYQW